VLARERRGHHVELFERDERVDLLLAREVRGRVDEELGARVVRQVVDGVERVVRPGLVPRALARQQLDARPLPLALARKVRALEVARHADDLHRPLGRFRQPGLLR
jgi:hypothetical protein